MSIDVQEIQVGEMFNEVCQSLETFSMQGCFDITSNREEDILTVTAISTRSSARVPKVVFVCKEANPGRIYCVQTAFLDTGETHISKANLPFDEVIPEIENALSYIQQ